MATLLWLTLVTVLTFSLPILLLFSSYTIGKYKDDLSFLTDILIISTISGEREDDN